MGGDRRYCEHFTCFTLTNDKGNLVVQPRRESLPQDKSQLSLGIENGLLAIRKLYEVARPNESFEEFLQPIIEFLKVEPGSGKPVPTAQDIFFKLQIHFLTPGVDSDIAPLFYSAGFWLDAKNLLVRGDLLAAQEAMQRAGVHLDEYPETVQWLENEKDVRKQNAALGGFATAERYRSTKDLVAKLLKDKAPKTGWKSKPAAVKKIEDDIAIFVDKKKIDLEHSNLVQRLTTWLSKDEGLALIYHAHSAQVLTSTGPGHTPD